jgi:hypothetical protein
MEYCLALRLVAMTDGGRWVAEMAVRRAGKLGTKEAAEAMGGQKASW